MMRNLRTSPFFSQHPAESVVGVAKGFQLFSFLVFFFELVFLPFHL